MVAFIVMAKLVPPAGPKPVRCGEGTAIGAIFWRYAATPAQGSTGPGMTKFR
jgi:hypothetical protein